MSARAFALAVVVATIIALAAVAALNAAVDPTAQLGTGLLEPVAAGPRDRVAKVRLTEQWMRDWPADGPATVVVLGSSRTKKLDPAWLRHGPGVNAAVVGGDLFEARVLGAYLRALAERHDVEYPQLFVGVDVEQLRDSSLQGSGFLDVPQVAAIARREAAGSDDSLAGELDRLERLLLTWQVTKASAASVRARLRDRAPQDAADDGGGDGGDNAREAASVEEFTAFGVPRDDARWNDPQVARRRARDTPARIESSLRELRGTYEAQGARLDEDAVDDLHALVRIVHDAGGPPPVLYLTPAHHRAIVELGPLGRDERHDAVWALLRELDDDGLVQAVDCTSCIDRLDSSWIDSTHPSPLGMRQLATQVSDRLRPRAG